MRAKPGRFELVRVLSSGRKRFVAECFDRELETTVALKAAKRRWRSSPGVRSQLRAEYEISRGARHPNLVSILELGLYSDAAYLVMARYVGGALRKRIEEGGRMSPGQALRLCAELAGGLQALHDSGYVHLDVKPANILLGANTEPALCDYGITRPVRILKERRGYLGGTPGFMSPEQAGIVADPVDCRSDVFSLGVSLVQLLTGSRPFPGGRAAYLSFLRARRSMSEFLSSVPSALRPLCERALARAASDRFQSADEMATALRGAMAP